MKTAWLLVVLVACGRDAHNAPPAPAPAPAPGSGSGCEDNDVEAIRTKKKQYAKDAIIAFRSKLTEAHLEPLKLGRVEMKISDPSHDKAPDVGSTITTKDGVFIAGHTFSVAAELPPPDVDIAIDPDKKIYVIERVPEVTPDPYRACECVPTPCPPPASADIIRVLYGPLPKDATVVGSKSISFAERRLAPSYLDKTKLCTCPPAGAATGSGSGSSAIRGTPDAGVP
jgi:hypothetical protein